MNGSKGIVILSTNHGDHPPEKWALASAHCLVNLDEKRATPEQLVAARKLEADIAAVLVPHHKNVQDTENGHLRTKGDARLGEPLDADAYIDQAVDHVIGCAKGTVFEEKFATPEARQFVAGVIGDHFRTSMHNARSWHCDRQVTAKGTEGVSDQVKAFRSAHHPGSA